MDDMSPPVTKTPRPSTTDRDRARRITARGHPPCHLCGEDINYKLRTPDPMSYELDHVIPLDAGGTHTPDNWAPSHRQCNRAKSNSLPGPAETGVLYVTERRWN